MTSVEKKSCIQVYVHMSPTFITIPLVTLTVMSLEEKFVHVTGTVLVLVVASIVVESVTEVVSWISVEVEKVDVDGGGLVVVIMVLDEVEPSVVLTGFVVTVMVVSSSVTCVVSPTVVSLLLALDVEVGVDSGGVVVVVAEDVESSAVEVGSVV